MNRNKTYNAIVVSLKPLGENNTGVTLITKEAGIIYATMYGGSKSKLRSLVSLWNSGIIYIYENQEKKQNKISDFDVKNYHYTFSQNLFKSFAASLCAEIVIKTRCAGSYEQCWTIANGFLDGLDLVNEEQGKLGLIRFMWRYIQLLGIQPDATICSDCNQSFLEGKFAPDSDSYYNNYENSFVCADCQKLYKHQYSFVLKTASVSYLGALTQLNAAMGRKLQIDNESYNQLKNLLFFLIENSIDGKLNSLITGAGIL